ncbi:MAG: hypothetical protein JJT96_18030 [Opitutales bacterium]|nr:hypothetical protein [Opitutales bacterium]
MKPSSALWFLTIAATAAFVAGCASNPESRAAAAPYALAGIVETERQRVLDGQIAIGDTPEVVEIAWGRPDRKTRVVRGEGESQKWVYLGYEGEIIDTFPRYHFPPRYHNHPHPGRYVLTRHPFVYPEIYIVRRPYARQTVEFREGRVAGFETDER